MSPFQDATPDSSPIPLRLIKPCLKDTIFDLSDDEETVDALGHDRVDISQDEVRQEFIEKLQRLERSRTVDTSSSETFFTGELEGVVGYSVHVDTLPLSMNEATTLCPPQIIVPDGEQGTTRDRSPSPAPAIGAGGLRFSKTGGLDKMSFRELVKTSITQEDARRPSSPGVVVEHCQAVGATLHAGLTDAGSVEEALDALSFLADQTDEDIDTTLRSTPHRRWRLASLHSSSDLEDDEDTSPRLWFGSQETRKDSFRLRSNLTRQEKVATSGSLEVEADDTEAKTQGAEAIYTANRASEGQTQVRVARSTAPTIIAMTPKWRGSGSPAMGGRRGWTPPPEVVPRRRPVSPRDPPGEGLSASLLKLLAPLEDSPTKERLTPPPDLETDTDPPSASSAAPPLVAEPATPNDEAKRQGRPRVGVLKTSRDPSREARRSLRVSWGDLPEDFNHDDNPPETTATPPAQEERGYRVTPL